MKTYQVELQRITYITYTVQADSEAAAENEAWAKFETDYPTQTDIESATLFHISEAQLT